MKDRPDYYGTVERCVEDVLRRLGGRINLATPLGLGKAIHLINEFYWRACEDPRIELRIFTALTLGRPRWKSELERRFVEPLSERLFGNYPELDYLDAVRSGELPSNIQVSEFYFQPGGFLDSPTAQQSYIGSNYTHAVRDLMERGINVIAQLVAREGEGESSRFSLSCNPDLTLDMVPLVRAAQRQGAKVAVLGQVNRELPFMYGDASVAPDYFDAIVEAPQYEFTLFSPPHQAVSMAEYAIALHVSALIRDGGTLQVGIGSLGDAITQMIKLRHEQADVYGELLGALGVADRYAGVIERLGGTGPFQQGLYASSEMLVDGFLELRRAGILRRMVYDSAGLQRLLNDGRLTEEVTPTTLGALVEAGVIGERLSRHDFEFLQRFGVLQAALEYDAGEIVCEDGTRLTADLSDEGAAGEIARRCLGTRLRGGHFAHACFFLGPPSLYEGLRRMEPSEREQIGMTRISYVNELFGDEKLKRLQRRDARFVNTGLIVTLGGAVASDGLEDGRVLSGVGGQYNFVAMAHALEDGRSILMIRSTGEEKSELRSNVRWSYGHVTIPRHLRDLVVTEYGIAELRGRNDEEIAIALIEIADSRFQDELVDEAKRGGKIDAHYRVPDHARNNLPERIEELMAPFRERKLLEPFPFGTELTPEELGLKKALTLLKRTAALKELHFPDTDDIRKTVAIPESARPYLERMGLEGPNGAGERIMQRAVVYALAAAKVI